MAKLKIAITHGDINGTNYEVILQTFSDLKNFNNIIPIIYGSPKVLGYYKKKTNLNVNTITINDALDAKNTNVFVINCNSDDIKVDLGSSTVIAGLAAYQAIEKVTMDLKKQKVDIVITSPINSENVIQAGLNLTNHNTFFAEKFNVNNYMVLLLKENLKIGIATNYCPIYNLKKILTKELILNKLILLNDTLKKDFLITKPKIAVLGIQNSINDFEDDCSQTIIKAIEEAKTENINVLAFGPYIADNFFGNFEFNKFDAVLAMYHEQAYIPFKILALEDGVQYTVGMPFIHVAPISEVNYELAGKNIAPVSPFRNAVYLACDIIKNRIFQNEISQQKLDVAAFAEDIREINKIDE